ncbi:Methionine gamma-lyase [Actinomyces bovis]|uniref:Methionine gamma-lyase n=1 Tax=Actinomyces bovis TaxID=1658 RepID=A0ABY1VLP5_9ACTO|nr:PLP-dependent transferase [Actinomyces bovis]SPT53024.1 Methionine gamma-lyase [Actinomyces bovis]VEG55288.1 Methionine gamma-lyase [Actinomyces israelii]
MPENHDAAPTLPTAANPTGWRFETKQVQAGHIPDADTGARAIPIYQSTSFVFPDAQEAADRFALKSLGPIYTRLDNPTNQIVAQRIAALEGGVGALLVASGLAAETLTFLTLGGQGSNIVASPSLYGGTTNLLTYTLPRLGIETRFVTEPSDPAAWAALADERTICFFGESIPNPKGDILDIEPIAATAHAQGIPLVVDNTMASPYLIRPIEWGADIVVESATKFLGGHGSSVLGAIVDAGNFDFAKYPERFSGFNTPTPSYNGLVYARDLGVGGALGANLAFILKAVTEGQRDMGFAASPMNAFLVAQGVETLSLRMERHVDNTLAVARWLEARPEVAEVRYSGLESSPYYQLHRKYCPRGAGSVFAFDLAGGREAGEAFMDHLTLFSNLANIGDVRSLCVHPASTTHSQLDDAGLARAGITPGTVRLSIGIEHIDDILADLEQALDAVAKL